ncbi:Protein kinase superfamily protein [Striga hermonthica]|uniref:Protein kinase superfamily protein n=1 Tax=Striga hermonthica TaxID=68872 RepID=A0A9N7MR18_STRHE|nr:Protein kinase superfamily protein [Striga hermonthica]
MEERKKYPIGVEFYTLYEEVGTGVSAAVHRALCNPLDEVVAIKILDFERNNSDLNNISREAQTMVLVDHPNVLKSHCSFVNDHNLWVVMPYMAGGSCLHILKAAHPDGFEEVVIATILRDVLKGLDYLHQHGHIHRDVKAGNVLIDSRGGIKLGDFGVSAYLFDAGDRQRMRNTFVGTPCWMAPEVMEQVNGYDFKADIWSFGITALELAHGHAPFSKYPPMKVLLMTLQNAPPGLDYERDKKFSKSFKQMIASCLVKDPSKRPTAKKLLKHSFFKQARSNDYIARTLLEGLPALGDRLQALKRKEEDMLAQKKMPDGEKEEISQNEYKRGISGWNFNLDDMKAQASLIQDDDGALEKDEDMQNKLQYQSSLSKSFKVLQHQLSFASQCSDAADSDDNTPASVSSVDSPRNLSKIEKSEDDASVMTTLEQPTTNMPLSSENHADNNLVEKAEAEANKRLTDGAPTNSGDKVQNQSRAGPANQQPSESVHGEIISKGSKTSVNGDEADEKAKNQVVQQKGRFKVTSENVEQAVPAPILQKSHSMQVMGPLSSISSPPLSSISTASLSDATSSFGHAIFPSLQSVLQTNIVQRDSILHLMKQIAVGDPLDVECPQINMAYADKSLLDASHDRERELLREINDLQLRLARAQEELQKYKAENSRLEILHQPTTIDTKTNQAQAQYSDLGLASVANPSFQHQEKRSSTVDIAGISVASSQKGKKTGRHPKPRIN